MEQKNMYNAGTKAGKALVFRELYIINVSFDE